MTQLESQKNKELIKLGGANPERLYLKDLEFIHNGQRIKVEKSNFPGVDMGRSISRHKARYALAFMYVPVDPCKVLDFPCGSGYGAEIFTQSSQAIYEGYDIDPVTIAYANKIYGSDRALFGIADLCSPNLSSEQYHVIACCEGFEHIESQYQPLLLDAFYQTLKTNGTLVVTSPENPNGVSGKSSHNPFHPSELTKEDFLTLLYERFGEKNVTFLEQPTFSSTTTKLSMINAICRKTAV